MVGESSSLSASLLTRAYSQVWCTSSLFGKQTEHDSDTWHRLTGDVNLVQIQKLVLEPCWSARTLRRMSPFRLAVIHRQVPAPSAQSTTAACICTAGPRQQAGLPDSQSKAAGVSSARRKTTRRRVQSTSSASRTSHLHRKEEIRLLWPGLNTASSLRQQGRATQIDIPVPEIGEDLRFQQVST